MMSRKREAVLVGIGILAGLALSGPAAQAADYCQRQRENVDFRRNEM